jgi:hypothetical protein
MRFFHIKRFISEKKKKIIVVDLIFGLHVNEIISAKGNLTNFQLGTFSEFRVNGESADNSMIITLFDNAKHTRIHPHLG